MPVAIQPKTNFFTSDLEVVKFETIFDPFIHMM